MSFSTIPDLCLLTILDRIPLRDLLSTVNLVCHLWARLRPVACHRRPLLVLYDNKDYLDRLDCAIVCHPDIAEEVVGNDGGIHFDKFACMQYHLEYSALFVSELNDQKCAYLITHFPRLTKLHLFQSVNCWPTVISHVNHLLEKWSDRLVNCGLWLYDDYRTCSESDNEFHSTLIDALFDRLNLIISLKRLTLIFEFPYNRRHRDVNQLTSSLCPALSRLEHFEYKDKGGYFEKYIHRDLEVTLKQSNCALKTITLDSCIKFGQFLQFSPQLVSKLTDYNFGYDGIPFSKSDILLGLSRLSSLDTLTLGGSSLAELGLTSFPQLIARLTHLSQLTLLQFEFSEAYFKSITDPSTVQPSSIHHQMPSIKAVQFRFNCTLSHSYVEQLSIPHIFPHVQVIRFVQYISGVRSNPTYPACRECPYAIHTAEQERTNGPTLYQLRKCCRQSVKSLKNCSTLLRKIYFSRYFYSNLHSRDYDVCCVLSSNIDELDCYIKGPNFGRYFF